MSVLDEIRKQYPTLAFLVNNPEIGPLLRDAVDPNKGFSPQEFQARLYQTNWFKSRSTVKRSMETMAHVDPAEYRRIIQGNQAKIQNIATQMGLNLSPEVLKYMAVTHTNNGVEIGSDEFMINLRAFVKNQGHKSYMPGGTVAANITKNQEIARSQYYVPLGPVEARQWAIDMAMGLKDEASFAETMNMKAQSLYPHLRELLVQGQSMEDIFGGHRQLIAQELEMSPNQIDFTKDWKKVLYQIDPETKNPRPMTLHETQTLARQDSRWWGTSGGRKADAGMANFMLKMFGKRA